MMATDVPVTFKHTLERLDTELQISIGHRQKRHIEFTERLHDVVTRYERVTSNRLRRLRDNGITVNRVDLRQYAREKTFAAQELRHRREPNQIQVINVVPHPNTEAEHKANVTRPGTVLEIKEAEEPRLRSQHVQKSSQRERPHGGLNRRVSNVVPPLHGRTQHQASQKSHNADAFHKSDVHSSVLKRRNSQMVLFPSETINTDKMSMFQVISEHPSGNPGKCILHGTCSLTCKGRLNALQKSPEQGTGSHAASHHYPGFHGDEHGHYKFKKIASKIANIKRLQMFKHRKD